MVRHSRAPCPCDSVIEQASWHSRDGATSVTSGNSFGIATYGTVARSLRFWARKRRLRCAMLLKAHTPLFVAQASQVAISVYIEISKRFKCFQNQAKTGCLGLPSREKSR